VEAYGQLTPVLRLRLPEFTPGSRKMQHLLSKLLDDFRCASFRLAQPLAETQARLLSASGYGAGAWLKATPNTPSKTFLARQYTSAVCRLLNLPQPAVLDAMVATQASSGIPSTLIKCGMGEGLVCGDTVTVQGQHFGVCKHSKLYHQRHGSICRIVKNALEEASFSVSVENSSIYPPRVVADDRVSRRMDLVAVAPDQGTDAPATALCIDVSVTDATAASNLSTAMRPGSQGGTNSATTRLHAANKVAAEKKKTYFDTPAL
jgi:hypothetical protein